MQLPDPQAVFLWLLERIGTPGALVLAFILSFWVIAWFDFGRKATRAANITYSVAGHYFARGKKTFRKFPKFFLLTILNVATIISSCGIPAALDSSIEESLLRTWMENTPSLTSAWLILSSLLFYTRSEAFFTVVYGLGWICIAFPAGGLAIWGGGLAVLETVADLFSSGGVGPVALQHLRMMLPFALTTWFWYLSVVIVEEKIDNRPSDLPSL